MEGVSTDWGKFARDLGAEVKARGEALNAKPQALPAGLLSVPTLPETLLPEAIRPWLVDIAERLQVPLDFCAAPAIVGLSSIIGNQIRIRPKRRDDWTVTPNKWGAIVGRPGVLKSPAIKEALKPLKQLEEAAQKQYKLDLDAYKFDKEKAEITKAATKEQMKAAAKKGSSLESYRGKLADCDIEEPTERRYIVNDSTVAKYGELLNENPNGLLIFRDELTGWLRSLDDEVRINDRTFYLEAWEGNDNYTYDRIGRGTLHIKRTTTSVFGGIQPGPLQSYLRAALGDGIGDDGLLQRFQVIVYPDLPDDWVYVDRWPESKARTTAHAVFNALNAVPLFELPNRAPEEDQYLHFDEDAQELFIEWYSELSRELQSGKFNHAALESHFSKYRSLMPSLALTFELIDAAAQGFSGFGGSVSLHSAEIAAAWCEFLMDHARRIYGLAVSATAIHARTLARHLQQGHLPSPFRTPQLYHKGWTGLDSAEAIQGPLDLLESLDWIRAVPVQTGGRPTVDYLINPRISEVEI